MKESDVYLYLQSLLPNEFQWCNPYLDTVPLPVFGKDYGIMTLLDRINYGWTQDVQTQAQNDPLALSSNLNRIYNIQLDHYGNNSADIAAEHNQRLLNALQKETRKDVGLKKIGDIRNLTELLPNKKFQKRYSFDVSLFVIDTVTVTPGDVIESVVIEKVIGSKGNNSPLIIGSTQDP